MLGTVEPWGSTNRKGDRPSKRKEGELRTSGRPQGAKSETHILVLLSFRSSKRSVKWKEALGLEPRFFQPSSHLPGLSSREKQYGDSDQNGTFYL